jgi:hypothetical protein
MEVSFLCCPCLGALSTFPKFYKSLMEWSTALNHLVLLKNYLGPDPEVGSFVREQLITPGEEDRIREAIRDARPGNRTSKSRYTSYLRHTHLDLKKVSSDVGLEALVGAMFDLELGDRVKRLQLNRYSEVHEARALIEDFVWKWKRVPVQIYDIESIWWDGINPVRTSHTHWISAHLSKDKDFYAVLGRWLHDRDSLQTWLDGFKGVRALANNAESGHPLVFSAEVASQIIGSAEVRSTKIQE